MKAPRILVTAEGHYIGYFRAELGMVMPPRKLSGGGPIVKVSNTGVFVDERCAWDGVMRTFRYQRSTVPCSFAAVLTESEARAVGWPDLTGAKRFKRLHAVPQDPQGHLQRLGRLLSAEATIWARTGPVKAPERVEAPPKPSRSSSTAAGKPSTWTRRTA